MANVINATSTGNGGLVSTGDDSGVLNIQTNETTAATIDASQNVSFTNGVNLPNTFGFKNRLINGGMVIDQRNAGASVTPTDGQFIVDRWRVDASQTSKLTAQQNAGSVSVLSATGQSYYLGVTSSSAYSVTSTDYFAIEQIVEGYNMADFSWGTPSAKAVTLSFWVYSSLTGTFGGVVKSGSAGTAIYAFTYSIPTANTWTYITVTIPGPTIGTWSSTNTAGIRLQFGLGVGSTYSKAAGSWNTTDAISATGAVSVVGTNGATFYITGVQLEKGTQATSFDFRSYGTELQLCQRYFQTLVKGADFSFGVGFYYSSTTWHYSLAFKQEMRATPSLVATSGTDYYTVEKAGGNDNFDSFLLARNSQYGGLLYNSSNVSGTGGQAWENKTNNASSFVGFSAEL